MVNNSLTEPLTQGDASASCVDLILSLSWIIVQHVSVGFPKAGNFRVCPCRALANAD